MLRSFAHPGLEELWIEGVSARISPQHQRKILRILTFLENATGLADLQGMFKFHSLRGSRNSEYAMSVSGNYRITFRISDDGIEDLNYEDYH